MIKCAHLPLVVDVKLVVVLAARHLAALKAGPDLKALRRIGVEAVGRKGVSHGVEPMHLGV